MAALFRGRITVGGGSAEAFTARLEGRDAHTGITADGSVTLAVRESSPSGLVLRASVDLSFGGVMAPLGAAAARVSVPLLLESFTRCLGAKATARGDAVAARAESLSGPARRDGDEGL
jgi:hypothetical protein